MIFVDTNVVMYAVGRSHPLREPAQEFFGQALEEGWSLCTSAEVLQELMHAYLAVDRLTTLDAAFELVGACVSTIWSLEPEDVHLARDLVTRQAGLSARDLLHLACCLRRDVERIQTFDRALTSAWQIVNR